MKFLIRPMKFYYAESCNGIYCDGLRVGGCPFKLGCFMM